MTCSSCSELMMDVLYGEVSHPRQSFDFFKHLDDCPSCESEYLELIQTREMLAEWQIEEIEPQAASTGLVNNRALGKGSWWPGLQKVAAGVLILLGVLWILQSSGLVASDRMAVSEDQLAQMVHDMIVARQVEDWKIIGAALLELKEDMDARRRLEIEAVQGDLENLEARYVNALEENNRQVRRLISR